MRKIITVSREFGSGGRELGKRLADFLNINYYDGEIVETLSEQTKLDKDYLNEKLENGITRYPATFARSFSRASYLSNSAILLAKQHSIIKQVASCADCVIVGRGADAVLSELNPFKIFVYADMVSKIWRCKSRMSDGERFSDKDVERKIKAIDKNRKSTHDLYSTYVWGDKSAYNLCVNTSGLEIKKIIPAVAEIIENYFGST